AGRAGKCAHRHGPAPGTGTVMPVTMGMGMGWAWAGEHGWGLDRCGGRRPRGCPATAGAASRPADDIGQD
ncbi:hypothetical protein ABT300_01850, partial [Streptomyces sp. NPDC001027]|uniref:hypothetical protein n=1 Tax=Streptomyces sp. NPDC001027 TaxID=3154771 RepID=UPI00332FAD56